MNKAEAKSILSKELRAFAARPYDELVELISRSKVKNILSESGVSYQIEPKTCSGIRSPRKIYVSWAAFLPFTESLITINAKADIGAVFAADGFSLLSHENDYKIAHQYEPTGKQRLTDSINSWAAKNESTAKV